MRYHLAQLQAFCQAHPIGPKILIVPSMTIGHDMVTALAATGYSWVNLQIETPRGLAEKDAGALLIAEGYARFGQDADLFWLDEMIPKIVSEVGDDYFAQQATGLARPFLRTLHVLRAAGLKPASLAGKGGRHKLLQTLYQTYCTTFEKDHLYDNATLYQRALTHLQSHNLASNVYHAILDETPLPGLAFSYIQKRSQGNIWRIGREDMGISPALHSAATRFSDATKPRNTGDSGVGGNLLTAGLSSADTSVIHLRETLGTETEIRTILRDLRTQSIPLDAVEIAYTSEIPYVSLLCNTVQRFDIPATFADGKPITTTHTGQAIASFYRWIGSGFQASELIAMCRTGLITFEDTHTIATIIQRAHIGEGRSRYTDALEKMKVDIQERIEENEEGYRVLTLVEVETVQDQLQHLFDLIPQGPNVSLIELVEAGLKFLEQFIPRSSDPEGDREAEENDAQIVLTERLTQVAHSVHRKASIRRMANRLAELVSGLTFNAQACKPGHLAIASLSRAGYNNRKHLYIIGTDEGAFPGGVTEDPLLLDGERSGMSGELELRRTRPAEQVWHLIRVLGMASDQVTLLSCRRSLSDGRERYPAALFQQAAKQMGIDIEGTEAESALPDNINQALDDTDTLIAHYPFTDYQALIDTAYPWLVSGQKARRARQWQGLTTHDGWLGTTTPELAITANRGIFSPSKLEMLARCPYRYFLNDVLRIQPLEETENDPTRWLDPLAFGSLLHNLFHKFMQTLQTQNEHPDREQHGPLIQELLEQEIETQKETDPIEHQAAYRADVKRLSQAAQVFLAVESDSENIDPVGFEISFGFGESGDLNREEPVTLELADDVNFRIRGRIDRVDRIEDDFAIWDYKTGSMAQYDERDLLKRGTHLQWALYAYALDTVLKQQNESGQVQTSGYVFPGDKEHGRRISGTPPTPNELAHVLRPLLELVANGGFFHIQKAQECDYCLYNRVCGNERLDAEALTAARETMSEDPNFTQLLDSLNRWMGI